MFKIGQTVRVKSFSFTNKAGGTGMSNWVHDPRFTGEAVVEVTKCWGDYEIGERAIGRATSQDLVDYLNANANDNDMRVFIGEFDVVEILSEKEWYQIGAFTGEQTCAILSTVMGDHFVNCMFESVEVGDGCYKLMVASKYYDYVDHSTRQQVFSFAITAHVIIVTTQRKLREEGLLS